MMKTIVLVLFIFITSSFGWKLGAQVMVPEDGPAPKVNAASRQTLPNPKLREADLMWQRRVWRVIDVREKMNQFMYYPTEPTNGRKNLITIMMEAIIHKKLVAAYDPLYDDFRVKLAPWEVEAIGVDSVHTVVYDPNPPYHQHHAVVPVPLDLSTIKKFKIKEDWFFDRQRSVMEVRIVGICPVRERIDPQTGQFRGYSDMFWVYFPELRRVLANEESYNRFGNMAQQITYDDVFVKRLFASYITKEDNVYDRRIEDYLKNGLEALLEAEDIKEKIRNFEHDVWEQ